MTQVLLVWPDGRLNFQKFSLCFFSYYLTPRIARLTSSACACCFNASFFVLLTISFKAPIVNVFML